MKKIISILTVLALLSACSSGETSVSATNSSSEQSSTSEVETVTSLTLEGFKQKLIDNGLEITKETEMAADMIGGIDGYKWIFSDDTRVEVYSFDITSDAYKTAKDTGKVHLDGFGDFDCFLNGDLALMDTDDLNQTAKDVFISLK